MLHIIIPVRNKNVEYLNRCLFFCDNYILTNMIESITVVEYGSFKPLEIPKGKNVEIRSIIVPKEKAPVWNKSHALNIGFKSLFIEGILMDKDYTVSMDVDIIAPAAFWSKCYDLFKVSGLFGIVPTVRRLTITDSFDYSYKYCLDNSVPWVSGRPHYHRAVGGIQAFDPDWFNSVGGADETLSYWGDMDFDLYMRASLCNIIVRFPDILIHQEHEKRKEEQLADLTERMKARKIRIERASKMEKKVWISDIVNVGKNWGVF